jgi:putative NIF3 family GTP cyclohydrolase 1 type 2
MNRDDLVTYLDELLEASRGEDFCPNGLQVEGASSVERIVTGVSACHELFLEARRRKADAVLVHHGIFWKGASERLTGIRYRRVRELVLGEVNLIAYHLPLDRHPELGNNAVAARRLGLSDLSPFAFYAGEPTGFAGRFESPIEVEELAARCRKTFLRDPLVFGPKVNRPVERLAMVSGAAQRTFFQAIDDRRHDVDVEQARRRQEGKHRPCDKTVRINFVNRAHWQSFLIECAASRALCQRNT